MCTKFPICDVVKGNNPADFVFSAKIPMEIRICYEIGFFNFTQGNISVNNINRGYFTQQALLGKRFSRNWP